MSFTAVSPDNLTENVFDLIGRRWMLITAGDKNSCNTMTASWGGLGVLWGKNAAFCFVRPQRFTFGLMEKSECYTLSFFPRGEYRRELDLCGSKSGRDTDKIAECGFTVLYDDSGAPYFAEAELVLVCRKMYAGDMDPACFTDPSIAGHYKNNDYHRMYVGQIVRALKKD